MHDRARVGVTLLILGLVPVGGYAVENELKSGPSNNASLSKISVTAEARLVAETRERAKSYAVIVPGSQSSISVTATAQDPNARIHVNGVAASSGNPSGPHPLVPGLNILDVTVTAEDGKTQEHYEVKVIRPYPMPNWVRVIEKAPWIPRDSAGELVFKDRMWIFGGYIPELISDVWSSADGVSWEKIGEIPDASGINIPLTFVHDGRMWITSNAGRFYCSEDGKQWTLVKDKVPRTGYGGVGVVFKGKVWVIGGTGGRQIWSSSDCKDWKLEVGEAPWSQRSLFGNVVVHAGKLWVIGGCLGRYQPFKAYSDVWCSEDGVKWTEVTGHAPWPVRRWSSCVVYRNRIWLFGGFRGQPTWQNFNDVWYSADGKDWKQLATDDIWSPRHEISPYVYNDRLWVITGNAWPLMNDVWNLHIPGLTFMTQPVLEEYAGARYEYRAQADFNESAGPVHYRLVKSPKWLRIDEKTGVISGIPPAAGDFPVTVEALDTAGETARQSYTLHVVPL